MLVRNLLAGLVLVIAYGHRHSMEVHQKGKQCNYLEGRVPSSLLAIDWMQDVDSAAPFRPSVGLNRKLTDRPVPHHVTPQNFLGVPVVILPDALSDVLFAENAPVHEPASLAGDRLGWELEDAKDDLGLGSDSKHLPEWSRLA